MGSVCAGGGSDGGSSTPFIVLNVANHLNQLNALGEDFISCALRKEGLKSIPNSIDLQISPIMKDTVSWGYVTIAREKCSRVGCAESTTARCWNGIMKELLVEFRRYEREARERRRGLWGKSP